MSNLSPLGSNKDALIRISQFVIRKESGELAKDCQDGVVKTILHNAGNAGLSISEISSEFEKQIGLKSFPLSIVQSSLHRLEKEKGAVYEASGKFFLESDEFERIKSVIANRKKILSAFETAVISKLKEKMKNPYIDAEKLVLQVFYEFLVNLFSSESSFVANFLVSKKKLETPDFPMQILEEASKKVIDLNLREYITSSIKELLQSADSEIATFFLEALQNYVHLELLNVDPECRCLQKIAFSNKTLILDTNILMALLLVNNPAHETTNEIISLSKSLGINMVFTKLTKQEWLAVLEKSNEQFKLIRDTRPGILRSLDDEFVQSYFKEADASSDLTWQGFYMTMRQIESLARQKGIEFWYKKEYNPDKLPNRELLEPVSGRTYSCAKLRDEENVKSKLVCEHDAYHLLLIRKLREETPSDMLGPSCWFLTYDTTLLCVDDGINQFTKSPLDPPSSFLADMWLTTIVPFLGPEVPEGKLAETYANLMKTHFASIPTRFSASKLAEILGPWLPYKSLSDKDIEAILGDSLVESYYYQLREARIKEPHRVKELEHKLRERVDSRVYGIFDQRVAQAEQGKENAEKRALRREQEFLAERKVKNYILRFCAILGGIAAIVGLIYLAYSNTTSGVPLVLFGILFMILALAFRQFKIKMGPIELEAQQ